MIMSWLIGSILSLVWVHVQSRVLSIQHKVPAGISNEMQMFRPESLSFPPVDADTDTTDYQITAVSPLIVADGDVVRVQFFVNHPSSGDFVAAYAPASAVHQLNSTVPMKFGYCDEQPGYNFTGIGNMAFNLTNVRADVAFVLFSNDTQFPVVRAISPDVVTFADLNAPLRPRVVPTGDPDSLALVWSSYNSSAPVVKWGVKSSEYGSFVRASTSTIARSELCGAPATTIGTDALVCSWVFDVVFFTCTTLRCAALLARLLMPLVQDGSTLA